MTGGTGEAAERSYQDRRLFVILPGKTVKLDFSDHRLRFDHSGVRSQPLDTPRRA